MAGAPPDEPRPPSRSAGSLEQNAGTRTFDSAGPFDLPAFLDLCQDTASAQGDGDVIVDDGDGGAGDDGDDVGRPAGNIDWRLALVEADCEGLRDALNRSELQHQELLVRFHALQSSSEEGLRFDKDDNGKELGDLQERVRALERRNRKMEAAHNEAMEGLASDLVQCKMELASARGWFRTRQRFAGTRPVEPDSFPSEEKVLFLSLSSLCVNVL